MRFTLLLALACSAFAQQSAPPAIVSGVCQTILDNKQIDSRPCGLNIGNEGFVPSGQAVRINHVSAYCIGPIDRNLRMVRLDTQLTNAYTDMHNTFVRMRRNEVRSPGLHAEYQGSQLVEAYAGGGLRIRATVTAELGAIAPPITCEIRFQGVTVNHISGGASMIP
ncbi:MAG: hypothetical protein IT163_16810 [Bryobacterales bacterium]|nr:hypothetical protein [Bryobacterales bacterium]